MISKKKAIQERIKHIEIGIKKCQEYLKNGDNGDWVGFRPFFVDKVRDGMILPPHKDWVRKKLLPVYKKALKKAEDKLEKFEK